MQVQPRLKGRQHFDEKYVKVKRKDCYDLNCLDHITKYITAHLFVAERTKKRCTEFLLQIKKNCYEQILNIYRREKHKPKKKRKFVKFVCDGFENYKSAWSKIFYRVTNLDFGVPIKCKKYGLKYNNNHIERYNGETKNRIKVMRGGFRSFSCAENFMNLRHIIHNFVHPHSGLDGKTPAEAAGIKLNLRRNKLLGLIQYMARK